MTNREWLNGLNDEAFSEYLVEYYCSDYDDVPECYNIPNGESFDTYEQAKEECIKWLMSQKQED